MRRCGPLLPIGRVFVPTHPGAEMEGWMGAGEAAEGDEEIGGSEGGSEGGREDRRRGEGAQLGCSVVRRLARENPERASGRTERRAGGDGVQGCGSCVPSRCE